ncbi:CRISPR-associated helicase/endonuclease Cas3 [Actinomadura kijaniata]|uniref:CRISPR-associated endonuclease/helicase Cas3 n=1 Tax=Actinomadura namibiensis TaxID=182080 RepID=A0A7W3QRA2_ACTNM|nr:CRISPR-associated helicase Cas3' [Actinomadura namibiensis]MBA8956575.1 CRISPR-associated endonuclease/helicase Cas3 [Actinomadura namibiensis]
MAEEPWAHSKNSSGTRHGLEAHLRGTAELARGFASAFGAGELAGYLGLIHDVGKGACAWQDGLRRAESQGGRVVDAGGRSIDHKAAGMWVALRKGGIGSFALAVLGHHGGIPARHALRDVLASAEGAAAAQVQEAVQRVAELVPEILHDRRATVPDWGRSADDPHAAEMLLRMAFSALVDADFLDTERHFAETTRPSVPSLASLAQTYEAERAAYLGGVASPINALRTEIYEQAVSAAAEPPGIFPFPAPTGSGKTITSGGFSVHHATRHGLRRMIVAVPYLSITEQNARVYRRLFGEANVVEHHSGVDLDDLEPELRWQRLATENWDAPVVVTTTVQLFESLFSNKPSAMRKLHRLAGAVIVLDEVQSLPDPLLLPILSALRHLTEHFGTSVVLSSATQPAFFSLEIFKGLKPRPILAEPKPYFEKLRRVRFEWREPAPTLEQMAQEAAMQQQSLTIVNTTKDAASFHEHLEAVAAEGVPVLHLSTRMAAGHRRETLDQIRQLLKEGAPVAVVSTQLVEAGVDLDFPVVLRAFAAAEALIQAAGRCNRNGHLDCGRVIVFDPADGSRTGAQRVYGAALDVTRAHFGPGRGDLDDPEALNAYYAQRYQIKGIERTGRGVEVQQHRADFDFPEVARLFRLIDEQSVPVLVRYGDDVEREQLRVLLTQPGGADPWVFRKLQPYLATLPRQLAVKAVRQGFARCLLGDLYEWDGDYHCQRGIEFADPRGEDFVL